MAEKDDIPKGAADNLQKAAQQIASVAKSLEKTFAKGGDFAKAMSREVNETAKGAKTVRDHFVGIKDLNKDLASELTKNAEQQNIQNLALATGNSIAVATLQIEKEKAILLAREKGLGDSIVSKLEDKYNAAIQMTTELERQNTEQEAAEKLAEESLAHTEALKDKLKEITGYQGVFKDIFTDGRLAAGIFLNQVSKGMKNMTDLFDHARHEGHTVSQAFHETGLAISDSFSLTGTSAKDSMEVMSGMRSEMGSIHEVTREARLEAASLAKTYGISNEEAGKLTAQLSMMPGATLETANETAKFAGEMAKAAHVAPGEVMKDMAKNGENIAKFGKDGGKNMAIMAVAAKKVGIEMSTMANAAEGLLDFETSIEKQMEASVLLGREINLDKARQLALNGDLAGATKEMLANVGGEAEFNAMNVVQRKALADSMGVSVGELSKMVSGQDKLNDLTEDQQAALAAGEVTMDELAANAGGLFEKLKGAAVTGFSLVKGFSTLSGLKDNIVKSAKMLGVESFKQLKDTIMLGATKAKQFAIDKANMLWEFAFGKKLIAQKAKAAAGGDGPASDAKDAAKKLKKDGTPDMRFKDNKGVDKVADSAGGSIDKTAEASKKADKQPPLKNFKAAMANLREGLQEFGQQPGKTLKGVGVLVISGAMLGVGLAAIAMGVKAMGGSPKDMIDVGIALVLFAGSMFLMSKSLGKMPISAVLKGALALGVLGLALIPAAFAFSMLKGVDIGSIIAFSIALPLLALAAAGLGFLIIPIAMGALALAILGAALIPAAVALMLFAGAGEGIEMFQTFLGSMTPESAVGLIATAAGMFVFAGALFALAIAAFFGAPALIALGIGMLALGTGVVLAAVGLELIAGIIPTIDQAFAGVAASILSIISLLPAMLMMGTALFGMAAGLTAFAIAGVFTLPTIMGLIALSLVAPILIALGNSINFDLGGGSSVDSSAEDSKMDTLIEEIRSLKAAFQTPGVINMDGQKVGDVIGLAVSTSGVA